MTDDEKLLHELWAWCKDQPGYEPERDRIKGLLGGLQRALAQRAGPRPSPEERR